MELLLQWLFVCAGILFAKLIAAISLVLVLHLFLLPLAFGAQEVESVWGKDSSKVVIDEVAGMCVSLLFLPVQWKYITTAFLLFRFFDIVKPLYIRRLENMPKGWGVMLDDLLAGIYANLIMQIIIATNLFK